MEKVQLISKMSQGNFSLKDVSQLVSVVMRQACDLLDADRATLFVVRTMVVPSRGTNKSKVKRELYTFAADTTDPIIVPIDAGLVGVCVAQRSVVNISDAYEDKRFNREIDRQSGYRTKQVLCAPIMSDNAVVPFGPFDPETDQTATTTTLNDEPKATGVLQVLNRRGKDCGFSLRDEELIEGFAKQISMALDSIILSQRENDVKVRRFLLKYQNACVAKAWNKWQANHQKNKRQQHVQVRALQFWTRQKYARAWTPWINMVNARKRQRELMNRVLRRIERMRLHAGLQSWIRYFYFLRSNEEMTVTMEDLRRERALHREAIMKRGQTLMLLLKYVVISLKTTTSITNEFFKIFFLFLCFIFLFCFVKKNSTSPHEICHNGEMFEPVANLRR